MGKQEQKARSKKKPNIPQGNTGRLRGIPQDKPTTTSGNTHTHTLLNKQDTGEHRKRAGNHTKGGTENIGKRRQNLKKKKVKKKINIIWMGLHICLRKLVVYESFIIIIREGCIAAPLNINTL